MLTYRHLHLDKYSQIEKYSHIGQNIKEHVIMSGQCGIGLSQTTNPYKLYLLSEV